MPFTRRLLADAVMIVILSAHVAADEYEETWVEK